MNYELLQARSHVDKFVQDINRLNNIFMRLTEAHTPVFNHWEKHLDIWKQKADEHAAKKEVEDAKEHLNWAMIGLLELFGEFDVLVSCIMSHIAYFRHAANECQALLVKESKGVSHE